jgi:hypothetical protein
VGQHQPVALSLSLETFHHEPGKVQLPHPPIGPSLLGKRVRSSDGCFLFGFIVIRHEHAAIAVAHDPPRGRFSFVTSPIGEYRGFVKHGIPVIGGGFDLLARGFSHWRSPVEIAWALVDN